MDIISQTQCVGNSKEKIKWFIHQTNGIKMEHGGVIVIIERLKRYTNQMQCVDLCGP